MKRKINLRLIAIAVVAILTTVISITFVYYDLFQKQVEIDLKVSAKLLKDTHYFESVDIDTDTIDLSTNISELRVTWIDNDGTVLYDNDVKTELENHLNRPEIIQAFENGTGESIRKSDTLNKNTYYYAVLLDNGTVLRVAIKASSIFQIFVSALPVIILIICLIIIVCILLSHVLAKQLIMPIEQMAKNLENVGYETPYKELEPITTMLKKEHADVLAAAKARQDFTANVSHELKTPLTAISGYAELLEADMVEDDKKKHFYEQIKNNAQRLLTLINDIIRLSELDRKEMLPDFIDVDIHELANECIEELSVNASERNISLKLDGSECLVNGNKDMLKELIENLVQNAIRYNNPNGEVIVSTNTKDGHQILIVKDNGIGIPIRDQQRVFERFYRVDKGRSKATGGTGLGLAIVKHIVEIHDGKIELDSTVGMGTTIKVTF